MKFARMARGIALFSIAAAAQTATSQSKDEREIRAVGDEWQRALNAHDVDRVLAVHAPDAIYMLSHQPLISGATAIRAGWSEALKLPNYTVHWTPTKIDVASPRVATEYGTYTESYTGPDGKVVTDGGNYVTIWHKINGQWRVALDAPNTTSPAPAPATSAALSDTDRAAVVASVRQATNDFVTAAEHLDTDRVFGFFSSNPGFAVANNGVFMTSRDQFHEAIAGYYKGFRSQDINISDTRIAALTPNLAVETLIGTFAPVDNAGNRAAPRTFNWTFLWVREADGWKVLQGHQSFAP
jgi:uncharacterized protein (TIGR02246 family)